MNHIKKFNEEIENPKNYSDEDIKMFFTDYVDDNKDAIRIKNVLLFDNSIINDTTYIKDASKYRRCKLVTLIVGESHGIKVRMGRCFTSFDILENLISDLKRFYLLTKEEINYTINTELGKLVVEFIVFGDIVKEEESKSNLIDKYLLELKEIYRLAGYKRSRIGENWFEIKTPKSDAKRSAYGDISYDLRITINKINSNTINMDNTHPDNKYRISLINIKNRLLSDDLKMSASGGDHQLIIQLVKI